MRSRQLGEVGRWECDPANCTFGAPITELYSNGQPVSTTCRCADVRARASRLAAAGIPWMLPSCHALRVAALEAERAKPRSPGQPANERALDVHLVARRASLEMVCWALTAARRVREIGAR